MKPNVRGSLASVEKISKEKSRSISKCARVVLPGKESARAQGAVRSLRLAVLFVGVAFVVAAIAGSLLTGPTAHASNPTSATLTPTSTQITWTGTAPGGTVPNAPLLLGGETLCQEGINCDTFTLTLSGTSADWAAAEKAVHIHIGWLLPATDYDLYIHKGDLSGDVVANSGRGITNPTGSLTTEDADLDPSNPDIGTGTFAVHVVYYTATAADQYTGTASVFDQQAPPPPTPPTPVSSISAPKFVNYADPGGSEWGEPSIGINPKTNNVMFISSLTTLRVSFDDTQTPARATWTDKSYLTTSLLTWDPILFTDSQTGRTFVSQLQFPTKQSTTAFTDNDGDSWLPSQGASIGAGVDHQTIGGGPLHAPLTRDPNGAVYPNAVYYAAQDLVTAEIGVSLDGGMTFGPAVPMYTSECVGIHGHIKVAPDGTVYVPNRNCGGQQSLLVSKDNGATWTIKKAPGSHPSSTDPSLGIGADGTVYFGYADSNRTPRLAVYKPETDQWVSDYPVGGSTIFTAVAFPAVVAGDSDRAAFTFLGTTTPGIPMGSGTSFRGVWHLYIAATYDGGLSYTLTDATPNDPVQRGNVCDEGTGCPSTPRDTRNLLDFMDAQVDKEGRVVVGYADGCTSAACIQGQDVSGAGGVPDGRVNSFDNDGRALSSIARQSEGKRLFAAYDVGGPTPTPTPTPATESKCALPGITVQTDNTGDQTGAPANSQLDLASINIAEPFTSASDRSITFTIKAANLTGGPQINSTWAVYMNVNDTSGAPRNIFFNMNTVNSGTGAVGYTYGYHVVGPPAGDTSQTAQAASVITGSFTADGTITLKVNTANPLSFSDISGAHQFDVNLLTTGTTLTALQGQTKLFVGALGNGGSTTADSTTAGSGTYTTIGNAACDVNNSTPTPTPTVTPTVTPTPTPTASPTATPTPAAGVPQYTNYYPPDGVADDWGEPSIGANWISGKIMFFGGINDYALRVTFNDTTSPAGTNWDQTPLLSNTLPRVLGGDPILVTDKDTGRTFVSQLQALTPSATMDITDNDGTSYIPSAGFGIASGLDHQTIGVGPFHAPVPPGAVYKNAVYYCSQDGLNSSGNGIANCALSINGGLTFGPAVPVYIVNAVNSCFPLHGHAKVAPDGTVYLPNRKCGAGAGFVFSEDNGITWNARTVPDSSIGSSDASIGISTDGTVFFGYQGADGHPRIAVTHDKGTTWINHTDVGAQLGLQNGIFPAVVAGDGGLDTARAAFAFYGSTSAGDQDNPAFRGDWYLYVSSTFDGGKTWTTVNATPGDPMQRDGICTRGFQGCTVPRNLLDFFDATVDKDGRVIVGYQDGCIGACVQGGPNSNSRKGVIARQSGGKRLFAANDSDNPTPTPTPTPTVTPTPTPTPTVTPTPTPSPGAITPVYQKGGITFSPNTALRASVAGRDGEPSLRVDKSGNAYVAGIRGVPAGVDLWYIDLQPGSSTYDPLMRNPIYRGQPDQFSPDEAVEVGADGGGDVDLAVGFDDSSPGKPPYLAFSSLTAANISAARSTDRGATFTKNPAGNVTGGVPADDRQWMEAFGKNSVYLLYRVASPLAAGVIAFVQRSDDGGLTYNPAREVGAVGQVGGIDVDQNDGTVYVAGSNGVVAVGKPVAPGLEPLTYTIRTVGGGAHIFFTVKVANDGTVYVCYSDSHAIFIKYSRDKGTTWSAAVRVSDGPETATSVLPWLETGPVAGSIGVVWYGSTASSNNDNADWKVFFAQSLNATSSSPAFRQVELSDHFIHGSNISESGLSVVPGAGPNRNLLDYFQIAFDPMGAAVVAYTDDHNDFDGHVYVARQTGGPGVKGTNIAAPVEGSLLPPRPTRTINDPQVVDFAQDQKNGLLTVLPVNDPLDILSIKYSAEGSASAPVLVMTMKVSNLAVVPPASNWRMSFAANAPDSRMSPNGDYSFGLSDRADQFFVRATTDASGARTYTWGTAVREHQHRGFIAYTDRGLADSGVFDSVASTITIKISLSKLNTALGMGHARLGQGSILVGLRGSTFTTGDDNAADRNDRAKSDSTRGGTQYVINAPLP